MANVDSDHSGEHERRRQGGNALILITFMIVLVLGLAGTVTSSLMASLKLSAESSEMTRCLYLADSGIHFGAYRLRQTGPSLPASNFQVEIGGGQIAVVVTPQAGGVWEIASTATLNGLQRRVTAHYGLAGGLELVGAVELVIGTGVELEGSGIPVTVSGTAKISGADHAPDTTPLVDQSLAQHGLAMSPVPGGLDFETTVAAGATLTGSPTATANTVASQAATFREIYQYVRDNADVTVSGTTTLGQTENTLFGTPAMPALVYANLGDENTLTMRQGFTGYGTLVVMVDEAEEETALRMLEDAAWHGLVLLVCTGEAEVEGGSLIRLSDNSRIIGGLAVDLRGEEVEIEDGGQLLKLEDAAQLLYSSVNLATVPATSGAGASTFSQLSYSR